jgi:hypothetical protein
MPRRETEGIIARVHAAPATGTHALFLQQVAYQLQALNLVWLQAQLAEGRVPPMRLLLAAAPWTYAPVRYVEHHGAQRLARVRDYYDGPTAMHLGEATCIDVAGYDSAAMMVLQNRPRVVPRVIGDWPDTHVVIDDLDTKRTFDTTTREAALASLKGSDAWHRS